MMIQAIINCVHIQYQILHIRVVSIPGRLLIKTPVLCQCFHCIVNYQLMKAQMLSCVPSLSMVSWNCEVGLNGLPYAGCVQWLIKCD